MKVARSSGSGKPSNGSRMSGFDRAEGRGCRVRVYLSSHVVTMA